MKLLNDAEAIRIRAFARSNKLDFPENTDVETLSWGDLHSLRSATVKVARKSLETIRSSDGDEELRDGERLHDNLMAIVDAVDHEFNVREKNGTKEPLTALQRNRPVGDDISVSGSGDGPAYVRTGWSSKDGQEVRVLAPKDAMATERAKGPGVGDLARAMIFGARNDSERRALSVGVDASGGFTVPEPLAAEFIDKLRATAVVFRAGAQTVQMDSDTLDIAKLASDPTASWTAENTEITASDPTFERVRLQARKLTALVKVGRELLEDSVNVSAILENAFRQALALELDRAALFGSGTAPEPQGLFGITGVNEISMGTDGAVPADFDDLVDAIVAIQSDNGADPTAAIWNPRTAGTYAKMKDTTNQPLSPPQMVADLQKLATTRVPIDQTQGTSSDASTVLVGDFRQMMIGMRVGIDLRLLNERYAEFDQVGFIARMRADVDVTHASHFAKVIGVRA